MSAALDSRGIDWYWRLPPVIMPPATVAEVRWESAIRIEHILFTADNIAVLGQKRIIENVGVDRIVIDDGNLPWFSLQRFLYIFHNRFKNNIVKGIEEEKHILIVLDLVMGDIALDHRNVQS